jgi:hypothetical protein
MPSLPLCSIKVRKLHTTQNFTTYYLYFTLLIINYPPRIKTLLDSKKTYWKHVCEACISTQLPRTISMRLAKKEEVPIVLCTTEIIAANDKRPMTVIQLLCMYITWLVLRTNEKGFAPVSPLQEKRQSPAPCSRFAAYFLVFWAVCPRVIIALSSLRCGHL